MKKPIILLSISFIILLCGCKKDTSSNNTGLAGKWKLVGNMVSSGGPMYYVAAPVKIDYDFAQFNSNGTISGTVFKDYDSYTIKDSATVVFTKPDKTTIQNYSYKIKGDSLKMSPAGPILCFEGCAIVFLRVQ